LRNVFKTDLHARKKYPKLELISFSCIKTRWKKNHLFAFLRFQKRHRKLVNKILPFLRKWNMLKIKQNLPFSASANWENVMVLFWNGGSKFVHCIPEVCKPGSCSWIRTISLCNSDGCAWPQNRYCWTEGSTAWSPRLFGWGELQPDLERLKLIEKMI